MKKVALKSFKLTSSSRLTPALRAELRAMEREPIDTSDIPEVKSFGKEWKRGLLRKNFRPVKKQLTLRIDADVVDWFKDHAPKGSGYQTIMNEALRAHVETHGGSREA